MPYTEGIEDLGKPKAPRPMPFLDPNDPDLQALVKSLVPDPEKPQEPEAWRKALAMIGDAMQAYAGQRGTGMATLQKPKEEYREATKETGERRRMLLTDILKSKMAEKMRTEAEAVQERAILDRKAADDARATTKADHDAAMDIIDGLTKQPGFELPDEKTLNSLTRAQAQAISQAYWQKHGATSEESNFKTWLEEVLRQKPEGMETGSITAPGPGGGSITFKQPGEGKDATPPAEKPVSVQTMARADRMGLKLSGKETEIEASNLIAERQAADRDKKLSKMTPRGNKVGDEIVALMQIERAAERALSYGAEYGGLIQGSAISTPWLAIKDWQKGGRELDRKYEYGGLIADVGTNFRKAQSGAAVTPQEGVWMAPLVPAVTDLDTKREANLKRLAERAREAYLGRAQAFGVTDEDLDAIRQRMFGGAAPLPTQPGDIPLGESY